jgi:lysophospholipase
MSAILRNLLHAVFIFLFLCLMPNGVFAESSPAFDFPDQAFLQRLKAELPALDLTADSRGLSVQSQTFYKAYGIYHENAQNYFGAFKSASYAIAAYVMVPDSARGTVFCLHGYFDHFALLQHLVRHCLRQQYAVAGFDLPGHGLSTGEPNTIGDFGDYVTVLDDFIRICLEKLPQPYHIVAYSTGASISLELMYTRPLTADRFSGFILAAPLVRHRYYRLARAQLFLIKPFFDSLPRKFSGNSGDPDFVERLEQDPLQGRRMPLSWLEALYRWNDRFRAYDPIDRPVRIVQGTADRVVDWQYNLALLEKKIKSGRTVLVEGAQHQLFNESAELRGQVLEAVGAYLEQ